MKDKIEHEPGASRFPFAGLTALGIMGLALAAHPALPSAEEPYMLRDINQGTLDSFAFGFVPFGGRLFFMAETDINCFIGRYCESPLWVTDGTPAGTLPCQEFLGQPETWRAWVPTVLGDRLFFDVDDGTRWELWISDGTPAGTMPRRESLGQPETWKTYNYSGQTALGDRLLFFADDGTRGWELWVTDETPEGTVLLKDINPGPGSSGAHDLTLLGDRLFFLADGTHGEELWVTDGTPEGTVPWHEYLGQPETWLAGIRGPRGGDRRGPRADLRSGGRARGREAGGRGRGSAPPPVGPRRGGLCRGVGNVHLLGKRAVIVVFQASVAAQRGAYATSVLALFASAAAAAAIAAGRSPGNIPWLARELIRRAEPDPARRPRVFIG